MLQTCPSRHHRGQKMERLKSFPHFSMVATETLTAKPFKRPPHFEKAHWANRIHEEWIFNL
jgi:hypothetical protein